MRNDRIVGGSLLRLATSCALALLVGSVFTLFHGVPRPASFDGLWYVGRTFMASLFLLLQQR